MKGLTDRDVRLAKYTPQERAAADIRWDGLIPGFGLRIYPSGKKAFILRYRSAGRKRLITLGKVTILSLSEARELARAQLSKIKRGGHDPLTHRSRQARIAAAAPYMLAALKDFVKLRAGDLGPDLDPLRAAIAKAEGR